MRDKSRHILRIGLLAAVLLFLLGGGAFLVRQKKQELARTPAYSARPRPVTAVQAVKGGLTLDQDYLAVVEAAQHAEIAARVTAPVESVRVEAGDRVEAGQVLAELDAEEIEQGVDAITARIEQTEAELDANQAKVEALEESHDYWQNDKRRDSILAGKGAISQSDAERTTQKAADIRGQLRASRKKSKAISSTLLRLEADGRFASFERIASRFSFSRACVGCFAAPLPWIDRPSAGRR